MRAGHFQFDLSVNTRNCGISHKSLKVLLARVPKYGASDPKNSANNPPKTFTFAMPRHPTLGIPGSKPRVLLSLGQMLKMAEENAPKPAKAKAGPRKPSANAAHAPRLGT